MIKNTPEEHLDYETLCSALQKIKKLNNYVNEKKKHMDIKREFSRVQRKQETIRGLSKMSIRQVIQDVLHDVSTNKSEDKVFLLFSPSLIEFRLA